MLDATGDGAEGGDDASPPMTVNLLYAEKIMATRFTAPDNRTSGNSNATSGNRTSNRTSGRAPSHLAVTTDFEHFELDLEVE